MDLQMVRAEWLVAENEHSATTEEVAVARRKRGRRGSEGAKLVKVQAAMAGWAFAYGTVVVPFMLIFCLVNGESCTEQRYSCMFCVFADAIYLGMFSTDMLVVLSCLHRSI